MESIRVLHVFSEPAHGVWITASLARRQVECGYQVEFACGSGEYLGRLTKLGFPVHVVPFSRQLIAFSHVRALFHLVRIIRQRKYHVVHTHTPIASFLARLAAKLVRVPLVISHLRTSWWESSSLIARTTFSILEWLAGFWTDHVFTINCMDARDVIKNTIKSSKNVTCLHCGSVGVNLDHFDPSRFSSHEKCELRKSLGLNTADIVIGFIGRMVLEKGIFELGMAFLDVAKQAPHVRLLLVGGVLSSERDQETLEQLKKNMWEELSGKVVFTGFRDDIPQLLSIVDIVVLPSHREGFGMVLAEAAAMGLPVISTATRGGREAVIQGENGILVPINNVGALRDAILQLVSSPELRHRMGETGRRIAVERLDEAVVFSVVSEIYTRLLQGKGVIRLVSGGED